MTEDNKPTWQYVPPTSPTDGSSIDATRYMKGAPRRQESAPATSETAPTHDSSPSTETQSTAETSETQTDSAHSYETAEAAPENRPQSYEPRSPRHDRGPRREGHRSHDRGPRRENRGEGRSYSNDRRHDGQSRHSSEGRSERGSYRGNRQHNDSPAYGYNANSSSDKKQSSTGKKGFMAKMAQGWQALMNKITGKKPEAHVSPYSDNNRRDGGYRGGRGGRGRGRGGRGYRGRGGSSGGHSGGGGGYKGPRGGNSSHGH